MGIRKINYPLIIGTLILAVILFTCLHPEKLSWSDPYGKQGVQYVNENGQMRTIVPPIPPCKEYPWGTDHVGRDMESMIVYGCRGTMLLAAIIALGRILIALPVAILAAYRNKAARWAIRQFNVMFSAFPLIILVLLASQNEFFRYAFDPKLAAAFLLTIFGWGRLAKQLQKEVEGVLGQDFMEGEIAIGKSRLQIALQNILPHIIPSIIVLVILEAAIALLLLAQLGLLGLVLSGGYYSAIENIIRIPIEFDWLSLMMFSNYLFGTGQGWLILYPTLAFSISIVGFNLLGEGLRIEFSRSNSRVITFIRGIPAFLSPVRLVYEVRHFMEYKKRIYRKLAFYLAVLLVIFFPQSGSLCDFDIDSTYSSLSELKKPKYLDASGICRDSETLSKYLSGELKKYGIQPFEGSYMYEVQTAKGYNQIGKANAVIFDGTGKGIEMEYMKDFMLTDYFYVSANYKVVFCKAEDILSISDGMSSGLSDKAVVVDTRGLSQDDLEKLNKAITEKIKPKVYIAIEKWSKGQLFQVPHSIYSYEGKHEIIMISLCSDSGDEILGTDGECSMDISLAQAGYPYRNATTVLGCIPGTDEKLKNEYIVLGSHIDMPVDDINIDDTGEMKYSATILELQLAKALAEYGLKPKRTIVFAFWDGPLSNSRSSQQLANDYFRLTDRKVIYFDLRSFASKRSNKLTVDTSRSVPRDRVVQEYIKILMKYAQKNDVELNFEKVGSPMADDFRARNMESIVLADNIEPDKYKRVFSDEKIIDRKKADKIGQMLLDTIIEISQ